MKQILIAFFAMFALQSSASVMVYDEVDMPFANYAGYLKESFDINVTMPREFTDLHESGFYTPRAKHESGYHPAKMVGAMLQSADKNCILLLPNLKLRQQWGMKNATKDNCGGDFMGDVYFSVRGAWTHEYFFSNPPLIDISRYSKSVPAQRFNAERANIVWLPANDSIGGQHFCAKDLLFFGKPGRPVYDIIVLFTAEGAKNKQKYLEPIYESLKFGNNGDWTFNKQANEAAIGKYIVKDSAMPNDGRITSLAPVKPQKDGNK